MSNTYLTLIPILFLILGGVALFSRLILALSSVLNALYYIPAVIVIMTHNENARRNFTASAPTKLYNFTMFMFLMLNFYLGLFCMPLLRLITRGVNVL
ncbi:MAG: hypothetical protein IJS28_04590 [Synergistaceae bacterium]|nr:hypothetical protein [Synergistaceae bacterium]